MSDARGGQAVRREQPVTQASGPQPLPDAVDHWLFRLAPRAAMPFLQLARLDRPIGWQLLLLPCWQSSLLASVAVGAPPHLAHLALFLVGAIAMRGAGSTYNDIVDRDIDAKVERTRARPLPSGRIGLRGAVLFLGAQCLVGLAVLASFNRFTILLGFASLGVVALYPFMKRFTSWPQAVLGLAFAWGGLMGWAAAFGALAPAPVMLYVGSALWTIGYDTIYALQDVRDDAMVGIGSTARFFGEKTPAGVGLLYALSAAFTGGALLLAGAGPLALLGLAGFAAHLFWQARLLRSHAACGPRESDALALRLFRSNRDAGLILAAGLLAAAWFGAL